ncbi:MAG: hypothetical protein CML40_03025 [Rhodobacteraceae bacterium]|nr:MAG: hypothetical protein CML40_03025 [Paracoccaceae bacterium]
MQTSFLESLIHVENVDETYGDIVFPKGFEVRDFKTFRNDFELLANKYGLSLPAKLKKGQLIFQWKPFPNEVKNTHSSSQKFSLNQEEIEALNATFD